MKWRCAPLAAVLVVVLGAPAVHAQEAREETKDACADAYESAQRARKKGQLRASQRDLLRCARAACPAVLSNDCTAWLRDVDAALPTVVPAARDEAGRDLVDVRVTVDDEERLTRLEGKAIEIDPGPHVVRFAAEGRASAEETVVVREGEHHRVIAVVLPGPAHVASPVQGAVEASRPMPPSTATSRPVPVAAWLLGGASAAALIGFGALGVNGLNQESALDGCRPRCNPGDVEAARTSFLAADVMLAVSIGALAAGVIVYLGRPAVPRSVGARLSPRGFEVRF